MWGWDSGALGEPPQWSWPPASQPPHLGTGPAHFVCPPVLPVSVWLPHVLSQRTSVQLASDGSPGRLFCNLAVILMGSWEAASMALTSSTTLTGTLPRVDSQAPGLSDPQPMPPSALPGLWCWQPAFCLWSRGGGCRVSCAYTATHASECPPINQHVWALAVCQAHDGAPRTKKSGPVLSILGIFHFFPNLLLLTLCPGVGPAWAPAPSDFLALWPLVRLER